MYSFPNSFNWCDVPKGSGWTKEWLEQPKTIPFHMWLCEYSLNIYLNKNNITAEVWKMQWRWQEKTSSETILAECISVNVFQKLHSIPIKVCVHTSRSNTDRLYLPQVRILDIITDFLGVLVYISVSQPFSFRTPSLVLNKTTDVCQNDVCYRSYPSQCIIKLGN